MLKLKCVATLFLFSPILFGQTNKVLPFLPIQSARVVTLNTTEGSNMSLDISPDGRLLIFDLLGDIFTLPVTGGKAKQLTSGIAINSFPTWSPSGKNFAFLSDISGEDMIAIADSTGVLIDLLKGSNPPIWAKDSFLISNNSTLISLSKKEMRAPQKLSRILGYFPDGKLLYGIESNALGRRELGLYDSMFKKMSVLFEFPKGQIAVNHVVSPDGKWLVYQIIEDNHYRLIAVEFSSKVVKELAKWDCMILRGGVHPRHAISPDSRKVWISFVGGIHSIDILTGDMKTIPFEAEANVHLGNRIVNQFPILKDTILCRYIRHAHASPNGKQLVFSALNRIYIKDLPNGTPRILFAQGTNQFQPNWSPDGKHIAYISWSDNDFGNVWIFNIATGIAKRINITKGVFHNPVWSPNGDSIMVLKRNLEYGARVLGGRDDLGEGELITLSIKNGGEKVESFNIPLAGRPSYSNDGDKIYFTPSREGSGDAIWPYLISKNLILGQFDTVAIAESKPILKIFANEFFLQHVIISPDGKYIVFLNEENLFLAPVDLFHPRPLLLHSNTIRLPIIRFAKGGFDPHWERGGGILSWSYGNCYFQIDPKKILGAFQKLAKNGTAGLPEGQLFYDVNITPDKIIRIGLSVLLPKRNFYLALTNARMVTMKGNEVIENGTILIKNNRIERLGRSDEMNIPNGARIVDMAGKTILPGFIDLHNHLNLPSEVFPQEYWQLRSALAYGVTTSREPSGSHDSFGYEELLSAGLIKGPRLFNSGFAVRDDRYPNCNSQMEAEVIVKNRWTMGGTFVKQYMLNTRKKRQFLQLACNKVGLNMTNEVEKNYRGYLGHLKDGTTGIEHNPLWGDVYSDILKLMAASGVFLTPTLQVSYGTIPARNNFLSEFCVPTSKMFRFYGSGEVKRRCDEHSNFIRNASQYSPDSYREQAKIDAKILESGGEVVIGSHGEDPGIGAHFEIWALQAGGLSNMQALKAGTINAARALGMSRDLGSLEAGKIADLIILDESPLDNIKNTISIRYVMKDGILYDAETLVEVVYH